MLGGSTFTKRYETKFGEEPTTYAPYSCDGAMKSLIDANSLDPATSLSKLAKIDMKGVTTDHFLYDQYRDLLDAVVTVHECEHGVWIPLDVISPIP
jgi:branched-chain amino acid transport system substrate-binding protein